MNGMPRLLPSLFCALSLAAAAGAQEAPSAPPLTDRPGDAKRGLALIRDPGLASCLICHSISALPDSDQGGLGPALDGVAARYAEGELRQRVMDARAISPETIMPPYYSTEGLFRVGTTWVGQTIYSAQDVEDVVAFLGTLGVP